MYTTRLQVSRQPTNASDRLCLVFDRLTPEILLAENEYGKNRGREYRSLDSDLEVFLDSLLQNSHLPWRCAIRAINCLVDFGFWLGSSQEALPPVEFRDTTPHYRDWGQKSLRPDNSAIF